MITELEKLLRKEIEQRDEIIRQLKELVADLEKQLTANRKDNYEGN